LYIEENSDYNFEIVAYVNERFIHTGSIDSRCYLERWQIERVDSIDDIEGGLVTEDIDSDIYNSIFSFDQTLGEFKLFNF